MNAPTQEDPVKGRILEAEMALSAVSELLELEKSSLKPGVRSKAEAFVANAPSLYGYDRDAERIFLTLDIAESAIESDPTFGGGYALAAACIYRLGAKEVDEFDSRALTAAIPWAFRAISIDPACEEGWEVYTQIHCYKRDFGTAEGALGHVFKRFGDSDLYARCAFLYFRLKGDNEQALNWGALAWQSEWDTLRLIHTLFSLGKLYRDVKQWGKALDAYRMIYERDHENAWAYHYASQCAAQAGDFNRARELSDMALSRAKLFEFVRWREDLRNMAGTPRTAKGRTTSVMVQPPPPAAPPAEGAVVAPPPPAKKKVSTGRATRRRSNR